MTQQLPRMYGHQVLGPDWTDVQSYIKLPLDADILGLDTEFTGFDYWSPDWRLKLVQVYDGQRICMYDPQDPEQEAIVRQILETVPQFISHGEADCIAIKVHFGIDITDRNWDTHVMASLLWPHKAAQRGLKELVGKYLGPQLQELQDSLYARFRELLGKPLKLNKNGVEIKLTEKQIGEGFKLIDINDPVYRQYAAGDAFYVKHLFCFLEPKMYEMGVDKAWEQECQIRAIATRMQIRGMKVHPATSQSLLAEWGDRLNTARQQWETAYGCVAGSPKRAEVLIQSGIGLTKKTKPSTKYPEGSWTLTQKVLEELHEQYPQNEPLNLLLTVSENSNVATFLTTLQGFVDIHGRVHPSINTLGAETGRWTVKEPAVQTVSGNNPCRSVFVPAEGHVIVSFDLGQIEPRVAVALAGERNLIPALLAGLDVYSAGSLLAFGPRYTPKQRKYIKRCILGSLFGAGIGTLVHQAIYLDGWMDCTPGKMRGVQDLWKKTAPEIEEWSKYLQTLPRIDLESGRYVPQDPSKDYRAINSSCQGNARDALMQRMIQISKRYDPYLLMTEHDEILMEVPITKLVEVVDYVRPIMEQGFLGIPTPTDIEIFPEHWAGAGIPWEEYSGQAR